MSFLLRQWMPVLDMARQYYLTCVHSSLDDILVWILATFFGTDFIRFVDRMAMAINKLTAASQLLFTKAFPFSTFAISAYHPIRASWVSAPNCKTGSQMCCYATIRLLQITVLVLTASHLSCDLHTWDIYALITPLPKRYLSGLTGMLVNKNKVI